MVVGMDGLESLLHQLVGLDSRGSDSQSTDNEMKKVLLLLCQGFEEFEASVFTDVLGWSRAYGDEGVSVETVALRPEVRCTFNLIVKAQRSIDEIDVDQFDALAIPGGFEDRGFYEDAYAKTTLDLIRRFDRSGKYVASICVAALALGKSGILDGRPATTYHLNEGVRRKQLAEFGAVVQDQHVVQDENIITCSCPAAAIEVAFLLLTELTSQANTLKVRAAMGFNG